jgi:hypothetical protein
MSRMAHGNKETETVSGQWQDLFTSTLKFGPPDVHFNKLCACRKIWKSKNFSRLYRAEKQKQGVMR